MKRSLSLPLLVLAFCVSAFAQTSVFTYQGKLTDSLVPASGTFEMRFKLFDALAGGTQQPQPTPITLDFTVAGLNPVTVTNGIFTVQLDFGAASFPAAERFLEISVRHNSTEAFTPLSPRQKITSSPFSIKSLSAGSADALSSACVLCIIDAQISAIDGSKVTGTVATANIATTAGNVTGIVQIEKGGTGSATKNFVDLSTNQTVSGDKTFSNAVSATQYNIGGNRILASPGGDNVFAGRTAGLNTTGGVVNSFFGDRAGEANVGGSSNSFFGERSGLNSQSINNSFFGAVAGQTNVNGQNNTILGTLADVGSPNLTFATALGAGAVVGTSSTIALGRSSGQDSVVVPGNISVAGTLSANGVVQWEVVGSPLQGLSNKGYIVNADTQITITLPTAPNVGDRLRISGVGTGGWKIAQNAGQYVIGANLGATWTPRENNSNWRAVASSADGTKLVGVILGGRIWTSTDSGATWTGREVNRGWKSVASSADGTKLVAGTGGDSIFTSTDSGVNWTARAANLNWNSVASSADGTKLVAVVDNGLIYTSTDSGVSWTGREVDRTWFSVASSADGNKLVAVVYGGQIYSSTDSGVTWIAREANRAWRLVTSSADGNKLAAVVEGGQVYTSTDSGGTWTPRESNRLWHSIASSADGSKLVAAVNGGQIYTSKNSGVTWTPTETNRSWFGVASSADGSKLVAVVAGGLLYTYAPNTTTGTAGYLLGGQETAIELQYIGNGRFLPISYVGVITAF
jgi:hypothetical protein